MENKRIFTVTNIQDVQALVEHNIKPIDMNIRRGCLQFLFEKTDETFSLYMELKNKRKLNQMRKNGR